MLGATLAPGWAALPGAGLGPSTPAQLDSLLPLIWTPEAEITVGVLDSPPGLDYALATGGTFGPFYLLKAPSDGILEYLYAWTGYFSVGEPLARFYDAQLLPDLRKAKAIAGRFNAEPYIIAGLASRTLPVGPPALGFPAPTAAPVAPSAVLPGSAVAPPAPPRPRAGLERADPPTATARPQLSPAETELAAAERHLAETEQELAARRELQESGVLASEEVARFEAARAEAAAAVEEARRQVRSSDGGPAGPSEPPARSAPLPAVSPPPVLATPGLVSAAGRVAAPDDAPLDRSLRP